MRLVSSPAPTQTTPSGSKGANRDPLLTTDYTCPDPSLHPCSLDMAERSGEASLVSLAQLRWGHRERDTRVCNHVYCEMISTIKLIHQGQLGAREEQCRQAHKHRLSHCSVSS